MRFLLSILLITAVMTACNDNEASSAQAPVNTSTGKKELTTIQWIDSTRDYGKINEGQKLAVSFKFKNTGDKPLVIESVQPSCGCTVADFPRQPIAPGQEGEITGEFDSQGREGLQHKQLTVVSNTTGGQQNIYFEVNVVKKANATENQ